MVLLIGNYPADQQQSMQRFATMMMRGLAAAGVPAEIVVPQPFLGRIQFAGRFFAKWLGYLDKFIFFPKLNIQFVALKRISDYKALPGL